MAGLLRNLMPLPSRVRFVFWRMLPFRECVTVRLKSGEVLAIRRPPNLDLDVAYEVYCAQVYLPPRPLAPDTIRCVVDVGSNVGYTLVFLARRFAGSRLVGFEPHPENVRQAQVNIEGNHLQDRIRLHVAAAGVRRGAAFITNQGAASRVTNQDHACGTLRVEVMDFYDTVGGEEIDFLKIDCEGGEYDLLMDPRFAELRANVLAMEWHLTREHPAADVELMERLRSCGWDLVRTIEHRHYMPENGFLGVGILWGFRGWARE